MTPELFLLFAAIGAVTGFFSGLLGIGGGTIVTPLLITALAGIFPAESSTHAAIATSLAVIFFTSIPGAITHARRGAPDWRVIRLFTAGAFGGAIAAYAASNIPGTALNLLLAGFLMRASYIMFRPMRAAPFFRRFAADKFLPAAGAIIGVLSALLGIGGGVLSSPVLMARGMTMKTAIATWAVFNNPLALFAAAGYVAAGWHRAAELPEYTLGYVYLPALGGITAFSMVFAIVGANLTAKLPDQILRRAFGGILAVLAVRLLYATAVSL